MTLVLNGTTGVSAVDGSASTPAIQGNDTNTGMFFPAADTVAVATGGSERVRVTSDGNVGVGTSSPANFGASFKSLQVDGSSYGLVQASSGTVIAEMMGSSASSLGFVGTRSNHAFVFRTNDTERARIDSSGNLLVGTTSGDYHLLSKTLSGNYAAGVVNGSTSAPYALSLNLTGVTGGTGGGFLTCVDNANRLLIAGNGNVTNVNGSYGAISDAKLKENVVDATPKLDKLNQVRIVNFNIIGETQKQIGVIAQELEQIFPGMVEEMPDRDKEGNDLGTTTKSVKYSVFVPMLIKSIQELNAKVESLTAEIATLKGAQA